MRFLIIGLLSLLMHMSFAAVPAAPTLVDTPITFDIKDANKQFDRLNLQLSTQNLNLETLNSAVTLLTKLVAQADDCVNNDEKRLSNIDNQIQQTAPIIEGKNTIIDNNTKTDPDLVYLRTERKKWASQLAQCRLFSIRAKEAINAYETAIAKLKQEEALTRGLPLWAIADKIIHNTDEITRITSTDLTLPPQLHSPLFWGSMIGFSALMAGLLLFRATRNKRVRHFIRLKAVHFSHFTLLTVCFVCLGVSAYLQLLLAKEQAISPLLVHLTLALSLYCVGLVSIIFLFNVKKIRALFCWYSLDSDFFRSLMIFLLSFYTVSISVRILADSLVVNSVLWQLGQSLFLLAVLITAIYFSYYLCYSHRHILFIKRHRRFIRHLCMVVFIACGIVNIMGYHTLSNHLAFAGISTCAIIFTTIVIEQTISKLYNLCIQQGTTHTKIIAFFGYKSEQSLTELVILKTTLQIIVFALALYLIGQSWGYATYYLESIYNQVLYGIHFATFTFYPTRIIAGVVVFCLLYLLFRSISTALSRHEQFEDEEETQVAIASILTYVGFAIAMISALLVAGFDFTGLAIVAGALSVGIGLGLQSIVNNFVSGIILLIEKPIKPGDKINVDGIEGVVKKIRVRSTQITSSAREDIIIPNSDLITRRVTNYMYTDKYLSICCEVNVSYGSDTALVRELLLKVTHDHDEIIKSARNKPTVLFRAFGENALVFQVWFVIKDGNNKANVKSELHFAIERLFREHNITFALPQRDVHIKLSDIPSWLPTK